MLINEKRIPQSINVIDNDPSNDYHEHGNRIRNQVSNILVEKYFISSKIRNFSSAQFSRLFVNFINLPPNQIIHSPKFERIYDFLQQETTLVDIYRDDTAIPLLHFLDPILQSQLLHPDLYQQYRDNNYNLVDYSPFGIYEKIVSDYFEGAIPTTESLFPTCIDSSNIFIRTFLENRFGFKPNVISKQASISIGYNIRYLLANAKLIRFSNTFDTSDLPDQNHNNHEGVLDANYNGFTVTNLGLAVANKYAENFQLTKLYEG
jgi:hypothetical protein